MGAIMKNGIFALHLSLLVVSCKPKESQAMAPSAPLMNGLMHVDTVSAMQDHINSHGIDSATALGWVDYPNSNWAEVDSSTSPPTWKYVVQLGMKPRGNCAENHLCYVAQPITALHEDGRTLCPKALEKAGESIPRQYSVGEFTGVLVKRASGAPVVVTVHHGAQYLRHGRNTVLFDHHSGNAGVNQWLKSESATLVVPKTHIGRINMGTLRQIDSPDLMIFELHDDEQDRDGIALETGSLEGKNVYAIVHVFGLPMKKTNLAPAKDCEGFYCYVELDLATGGSGGPLFTTEGKLAGIFVGKELRGTEHCTHDQEMRIDPCPGQGCIDQTPKTFQKFITAQAIRSQLEKLNP